MNYPNLNVILINLFIIITLNPVKALTLYSTCTKNSGEDLITFKCPPNSELKNRDKIYCCGNEHTRYCCTQSEAENDSNDDVIQFMGTIIGYIIIGCFIFCLCNHTRKCLRKRQRGQGREGRTDFNVSSGTDTTRGQALTSGHGENNGQTSNIINSPHYLYPNINPSAPMLGPMPNPPNPTTPYPSYPMSNLPYPTTYTGSNYNPLDPPPPYPLGPETKS